MAKQTLYEVLGVSIDATEAEIERACSLHLHVLDSDPGIEDRSNRVAFVHHARDTLTDPSRRRRYDEYLAIHAASATQLVEAGAIAPTSVRRRIGILVMGVFSVFCVAILLLWQRKPTTVQKESGVREIAAAPSFREDGNLPDSQESAEAPLDSAVGVARRANEGVAVATGKPSYKITIDAADGELLKILVWSVYGIVGSRAMGTGIMIDNEKLLTNCHVLAPNVRQGKIFAVNAVTKEHAEITEVAFLEHEDACLVKAPGLHGQAVGIGSTALLSKGDTAHNIGYANGNLTASQGQFLGWMKKFGQSFIATSNYCDHGVSGGPLVDDEGRLIGLTTGGPADRSRCYSLTIETVAALRYYSAVPIGDFPDNYVSNIVRRNW